MRTYTANLSHRLGAAFDDVAAGAVNVPSPAQLRALAHPDQNRPASVYLTSVHLGGPQTGPYRDAQDEVCVNLPTSASYKPAHGGYPTVKAGA